MPHILCVNAGSSSLKLAVFDAGAVRRLATATVEIQRDNARLRVACGEDCHDESISAAGQPSNIALLVTPAVERLQQVLPLQLIAAGHRVVHGGLDFAGPVRIDAGVLDAIKRLVPLAPLHQPANLAGIHAITALYPELPQVACFDTAFHRGRPAIDDRYALPRHLTTVRRYGFHGLSYDFVSNRLAELEPGMAHGRVVFAHLGNGASLCAVHAGKPVACSMGFSVLDGLPMGTRPGALDPGVIIYLMREHGYDLASLETLLYRESGLLGLSGLSNDLRVLGASDQPEAAEAIAYFVAAVQSGIAAMAARLEGLDAVVFTGGIGENAAEVRGRIATGLAWLGLRLDKAANAKPASQGGQRITAKSSRIAAYVIPTDEEQVIARQTSTLVA